MATGTRARIEDVAAAAGVSIATVSRFINTPGRVAAGTGARVKRAIERLREQLEEVAYE